MVLYRCSLPLTYGIIQQHKQPPTTTDRVCRGTLINYTFRNFVALKRDERTVVVFKNVALKRLHVDEIKRLSNETSTLWRKKVKATKTCYADTLDIYMYDSVANFIRIGILLKTSNGMYKVSMIS